MGQMRWKQSRAKRRGHNRHGQLSRKVLGAKRQQINEPIRSRSEKMYNFDMLVVDDNDHFTISDDTAILPLLDVKKLVARHRQEPNRTNAPSASDKELNQLVKDIQAAGISAKRASKSKCANLDALDSKIVLLEKTIQSEEISLSRIIGQQVFRPNCRQDQTCEKTIDVDSCLHYARCEVETAPSLSTGKGDIRCGTSRPFSRNVSYGCTQNTDNQKCEHDIVTVQTSQTQIEHLPATNATTKMCV